MECAFRRLRGGRLGTVLWPAIFAFGQSGCNLVGSIFGGACSTELVYGINLSVIDSVNGGPIAAEDIEVVASDGQYAETVRFTGGDFGGVVLIVEDRAGTYRVEITAVGYARWTQEGVMVREADDCHVWQTQVFAYMVPVRSP